MPPVDFRLAPRPTSVDGLTAVPVDVASVNAVVTFDGAASTAQADATMTYAVGPAAGSPLFDLRQTIGQAWLDGAPIDPGDLAAHDVGAGSFSTIRVVDAVQAAGSVHTLRVVCPLATPDAQLGGAYVPALTWSPGPRLLWRLGMSDLNAARYLEAWLPSNLVFDRFPVTIEIVLTGTAAAHLVMTNGTVTALGTNRWSVAFPDWFAPLSQFLEVRAADTVVQATGTATLPVSGTVAIEAYKRVGDPLDLAARITESAALLAANETDYGEYLHDRFVVFFNGAGGGMEYAGATTTSPGALLHEAFHSWFARGVTPSSQADGWWDEGFTSYRETGASAVEPFDFLDPPVVLCSRAPFQRRTPTNAYGDGSRFFRGAAATVGAPALRGAMRGVYGRHRGAPVSTAMLEEHLVATTGAASLVDAFHRFVYGFGDTAPAPQVWLRDEAGHAGADAWGGAFWNSPDLWIRRADDGGTTHEPPAAGVDNWFHARVRNRPDGGVCRHFVVTFGLKEYAGTEFVYPADFLPCIAARADFELGPGEERVVSARWPADRVPPAGTYACLLASVHARGDHPVAGRHVWEHANLAQKNLTVVALSEGEWLIVPVVLGAWAGKATGALEIWREPKGPELDVAIVHRSRDFFAGKRVALRALDLPRVERAAREGELMDCGGFDHAGVDDAGGLLTSRAPERVAMRFAGAVERAVAPGAKPVPIRLPDGASTVAGLKVAVPGGAGRGIARVHLVHRSGRRIVGGVAVEVHVGVD